MLNGLIQLLIPIHNSASTKNDNWNRLDISGSYSDDLEQNLKDLKEFLIENDVYGKVEISLDNEIYDPSSDWPDEFFEWQVLADKTDKTFSYDDVKSFFFLTKESFNSWLESYSSFVPEQLFHKYSKAVVIVNGISQKLIGSYFSFFPFDTDLSQLKELFKEPIKSLPKEEEVLDQLHIISEKKLSIEPFKFDFDEEQIEHDEFKIIKKISIDCLSASLVKELYGKNEILVDGPRRTKVSFDASNDEYSELDYKELLETVSWAYGDKLRTEIRLALLQERLSLDIDRSNSLVKNLTDHLTEAFNQAKERFKFVILERKDEYLKELRHLLDDLKKQSDLVSNKIGSFLNNFLRDVLAAIILIAFSIFTKIEGIESINDTNIILYLFRGLSIYYTISLVFQLTANIWDIASTRNEFAHWKSVTRNLLPKDEVKNHVEKSLKTRNWSLLVLGPLIAVLYIGFIIAIWHFPQILNSILNGT